MLSLLSSLVAMYLGLAFPRLAKLRSNNTIGLLQMEATFPAPALLLLITLRPDLNVVLVVGGATAFGIVLSLASVPLLDQLFRPEEVREEA